MSVVLAGAVGCSQQQTPAAGQGAVPVMVATLKPETVTLTRELPGRVSPFLVAEVRPQVNGIIARRLYTEGGLVQAGQPLYQIEDATYRADNESARASLARAEATLVTTQLNARRSAELVKIDAVSKQDDEDAAAALRQAEADVKAARAAVDRASIVLGYARITAPISGRIGKSAVTQGALVTANQTAALATVQQLDPVYVDVTQSSAELLELRRALAAGTLKGTRDLPVTDPARGRHALRSRRQARVLGRHRRSLDRQLFVARGGAESGPRAVARHVRPRRDRRRRARERTAGTAAGHHARPQGTSHGDGRGQRRQGRAARGQGQSRHRRQVAGRGWPRSGRPGSRRRPAEDPAGRARAGD